MSIQKIITIIIGALLLACAVGGSWRTMRKRRAEI